jgi:hypothetical protein
MHFELLVEEQSARTALEPLLAKILGPYGEPHTWRIHKHQGKGALPVDLDARPNPKDRSLLQNLPASLRAYGKSLVEGQAVVVLVDLDDDGDCTDFKGRLTEVLGHCQPPPTTLFRIAIEELEAWFLGDLSAVRGAYQNAKSLILDSYVQDSVCGTWELLADAVHPGGAKALKTAKDYAHLEQKRLWARDICPLMDVEANASPSFCAFRDGLRRFAAASQGHESGQQ